jgi:hypothetical protein
MDLDTSSLWSWTVPLWGLFLIVLFLGGVLKESVILEGIGPQLGGFRATRVKNGAKR